MGSVGAGCNHVRHIQEETRRYAERQASLLERLGRLTVSLEAGRAQLVAEVDALRAVPTGGDGEPPRSQRQMAEVVEECRRLLSDHVSQLNRGLAEVVEERKRLSSRCKSEVYVAMALHSAQPRAHVA
jgi:hypothetical protein